MSEKSVINRCFRLLKAGFPPKIRFSYYTRVFALLKNRIHPYRHAVLLNRGLGDDDSDNEWANIDDRVGSDTASNPTGRNSTTEGMQVIFDHTKPCI